MQNGDLLAAASAAATYHHFNPTDEMSSSNMQIYRSQSSVTKEHLQPLETGQLYQHLYLEAEQHYKDEEYAEMVEKLEGSLKALLPLVQKCR